MKLTVQGVAAHHAAHHALHWTKQCDEKSKKVPTSKNSVYSGYKAASLPDDIAAPITVLGVGTLVVLAKVHSIDLSLLGLVSVIDCILDRDSTCCCLDGLNIV